MYQGEGLGDLGGPEFYGENDAAKVLKKRWAPVTMRSTMSLLAAALVGVLGYADWRGRQAKT